MQSENENERRVIQILCGTISVPALDLGLPIAYRRNRRDQQSNLSPMSEHTFVLLVILTQLLSSYVLRIGEIVSEVEK